MAEIQLATLTDIAAKADKTYVDTQLGTKANTSAVTVKADKTYVDTQLATKANSSQVLTDVPVNAKFTDTVYTHPTTAGNKHIPTGGDVGQVLKNSASGTVVWENETDTVTTINGKSGAIVKADIVALGIPASDTVYSHPANHPASIITGLSTVATSGSYNDLSNKPTIPTVPTNISAFTNNAGYITGAFDNTTSGLTATTIQEAINELKALIDGFGA